MKFQIRKAGLILITGLLMGCLLSCASSKSGGVSTPHKRARKKCDCPKWTDNSLQSKHIATWYA